MANNIMGIPIVDVGSLKKELETYKEALSLACGFFDKTLQETFDCYYEDENGRICPEYFLKKARQG